MKRIVIILSDWNKGIYGYNLDTLCATGGITEPNVIVLQIQKPALITVKLQEKSRELLRVGWPQHLRYDRMD